MPTARRAPSLGQTHRIVMIADGGALAELNEKLDYEGAPRRDFLRLPELVCDAVSTADGRTTSQYLSAVADCILCNVGSTKAKAFDETMSQKWTVRSLPLSVGQYERAGEYGKDKYLSRIRFHAYIGFLLGLLIADAQGMTQSDRPTIVVLTGDPHLIPCVAYGRSEGVDVRQAWWESALHPGVRPLLTRHRIQLLALPEGETLPVDGLPDHPIDLVRRRRSQ